MVKETRPDSSPLSLHKHKHVLVKFAVSFLLMGLAFRLFFPDSFFRFSTETTNASLSDPKTDSPLPLASSPDQSPLPLDLPENEIQTFQNETEEAEPKKEKCDIFKGDWIPDTSGPRYSNETCRVIESHQNCMKNGRPDSGYFYWRWNPRDCEIPRFDPQKFLDHMRNKSWAFIGDSISRNHVQSLLCILSQVEQAVEVYHDEEYRSKRWRFPSHNFTLSVIWTPFLIKAAIFENMDGISTSETQLYLDKLDRVWADQYESLDYVVIAGGKWFLKTAIYHEKDTVSGCHYCPGKNLTDFGFEYAYRKALELVLNFITASKHKPLVFLRTTTPDHFENGEWFSGGYCNRTVPLKEGEIKLKDVDKVMRDIELEEFEKAAEIGSKNGVVLRLQDTTRLSLLRPDGHPGPYRQFQPFSEDKNAKVQNDCLHWCLPGPIDSWNDLVMELLVNGDKYQ